MDEEAIREHARKRNYDDCKKLNNKYVAMHAGIARQLEMIPLDPTQLKHCPACEGALCEVCEGCHEVDRQFGVFAGQDCPLAIPNEGKPGCVAWTWAYLYLKSADKILRREERA